MESVSRCTALHVIAVSMVDICTLINSEMKRGKSNKSLKLTSCTVLFCRLGLAGRVSLWRCSRHVLAAGPWMPPGLGEGWGGKGAGKGIKIYTLITETASPTQNTCQEPGPKVFFCINVHPAELMDLCWLRCWLLTQKRGEKHFKDIVRK